MTQNLEDVLAVLPAKRRAKIETRALELAKHKGTRDAADKKQALALHKEQAALTVQSWNMVHSEVGSRVSEFLCKRS